jgi:hypothetical protein
MSPNWDGGSAKYENNQGCEISVLETTEMEVVDFNVERGYDKLMVNGVEFDSSSSVQPTGSMTWSSDYSVTNKGWKICPKAQAQACVNQQSLADCDSWVSSGYCTHSYVDYMTENCPMSCGFCQATNPFQLVGAERECSESSTQRLFLASGDSSMTTASQGPQLCANMAASDNRCGRFFEVGGGYCLCYTGACTNIFYDHGEDLYELIQA